MALTTVDPGLLSSGSQYTGFKNRVINGGMQFNQRGSTVTTLNDVTAFYPVDRYTGGSLSDGAITGEQSTDAPAGFTNSIKYTVTTADSSLSATQYARLYHQIEGFNVADFAWGTSSAATVTLSFWTKSSVTGIFGGTIQNSTRDRSYAFTYTINSANTWEQKSITVVGDQSGTWVKDNGVGLRICFGLAAGSSYQQATTNTWQSTGVQFAPSSALNLLATVGATWYVAGLQLEKGSTATSFDYRPYGTELQLCQRYFEKINVVGSGYYNGTNGSPTLIAQNTQKRAVPSVARTNDNWLGWNVNLQAYNEATDPAGGTSVWCNAVGNGVGYIRWATTLLISAEL